MTSTILYTKDPEGFRRRLREAREQAGLTQRQLAFEGCTAAYITMIEKGTRIPSRQIAERLARRLGVSVHWLATGEEDPLFKVIRQVIEEHRSGVEIPDRLIQKLDALTLPSWWWDWLEWMDLSARNRETTARPKGVPEPAPQWAVRYRRLLMLDAGAENRPKWSGKGVSEPHG